MSPKDAEHMPVSENTESRQPGRIESAIGRAVRWLIGILLLFIIGSLVIWFLYVGPRAAEISAMQTEMAAAQEQSATLEARVAELEGAELHGEIISVIRYVYAARFDVVSENTEAAAADLTSVENGLETIDEMMGSEYDDALDNIRVRLDLAKDGLRAGNEFAVLRDLEVLANFLSDLECQLFCE